MNLITAARPTGMMTALIRARAPLRLGLAGGGTDLSPFAEEYGGAILNATISLYAGATIQMRNDHRTAFIATDLVKDETLNLASRYELSHGLKLHRAVYNRMVAEFRGGEPIPVTLTTSVDAPPGSGLGSSSALVVAMVKAFCELLKLPLDEYEVAKLSHEIEREDAGMEGGRQDQYAATFGGVNFMEFGPGNKVLINTLRIKPQILTEIEQSLVICFSGISRDSATIIRKQASALGARNERSFSALNNLKKDATLMKEALLKGQIQELAQILNNSWREKKRTATEVTNEHIDALLNVAFEAGASAGKVSGAGGGGFLMLLTSTESRNAVMRAVQNAGGNAARCQFTNAGATAWRIEPQAVLKKTVASNESANLL